MRTIKFAVVFLVLPHISKLSRQRLGPYYKVATDNIEPQKSAHRDLLCQKHVFLGGHHDHPWRLHTLRSLIIHFQ